VTTASYPVKTSAKRRTSGTHSGRYPELKCICPQQVCAVGKSTVAPSRSRRLTVARPTCGNNVSLKHVRNSPTRTVLSVSTQSSDVYAGLPKSWVQYG
jgi:hypothetical protein